MSPIETSGLFEIWKAKEIDEKRNITLTEVSKATGLTPETIRYLLQNKTSRFDAPVLEALCIFFDVPEGPVPFLQYKPGPALESEEDR